MVDNPHNRYLLQFAREPVAGRVKTRMIPSLTAGEACGLHVQLVQHTARRLGEVADCRCELWVEGDPAHPALAACLGLGVDGIQLQRGADLGERMHNALAHSLSLGGKAVLVGSDSPALDAVYIEAAFAALDRADIVLGPALDGGYVLIGARRIGPALFAGVTWGSGEVLSQTLARAQQLNWKVFCLAALRDIDRPDDLATWAALADGV